MNTELTPLDRGRHLRLGWRNHVLRHRDLPERPTTTPASTALVCIAGIMSISWIEAPYDWGDVCPIPAGAAPDAVLVAAEHDLGRPAVIRAAGLHPISCCPP